MKVFVVSTNSDDEPILGVYASGCEELAKNRAEEWMNVSAGINRGGYSIGPRSRFGERAWVNLQEIITKSIE